MSYEINVLVINQQNPVYIPCSSDLLIQNEIDDTGVNRYNVIWPFFSNTPGILYSLVTKINEDYYSALKICDSEFDTTLGNDSFPWISRDTKENLTPFIIREKYFEDFKNVLTNLLKSSPQNRILFQTRYQGGDTEIVLGVIKLNKFLFMLSKRQISFNVCYIVEAD